MSTITLAPNHLSGRSSSGRSSSGRSSQARPVPVHVRLTRRGKIAIVTLAVVAISLVAIVFGPSSTATDEAGVPQQTTSVKVLPGHTLWQIAAAANPNGDIRATVDEIVQLNALPNASALQMGSEIAVPVYDK